MSAPSAPRTGAYQSWLSAVGLALLPFVVVILVMTAQFRGLTNATAIEQTVTARRLASGQGFTTPIVWPRSLAYNQNVTRHPELRNGPLAVLPTALLVKALGENEGRTVAFASMLGWLLAAWLVYGVGRLCFGRAVGVVAMLLVTFSPALLELAVSGDGRTWAMPVLLLLWLVLVRTPLTPARPVALGLLLGLAALVDYSLALPLLLGVLPAVLLVPGEPTDESPASSRRDLTGLLLALALVVVTCLPWLVRNVRVAGTPFPGVNTYALLDFTEALPGRSVERLYTDPGASPLGFAKDHQRELLRKALAGAYSLRTQLAQALEWVTLGLFLASLLTTLGPRLDQGKRALVWVMLWQALLLSLTSQEFRLLELWAPVLCLYAAAFLVGAVRARYTTPTRLCLKQWSPGAVRRLAFLGVLCAIALPGFGPQLFTGAAQGSPSEPNQTVLKSETTMDDVVLTDDPWTVALKCDRTAVWLPQTPNDLEAITALAPVKAIYFTLRAGQFAQRERGEWWSWAQLMPTGFHQFRPLESRVRGERILLNETMLKPPTP